MSKSKLNIKKILLAILWLGFAIATIVLLVAAVNVKNEKKCSAVHIEIEGVSNHFFIDKTDVLGIIKNYLGTNPVGQTVQLFDLKAIEHNLETDVWIKNAELFFEDMMSTKQINQALLMSAENLISVDSPNYAFVAGRIMMSDIRKDVYGDIEP
jgi:hypothetical protein